MSENLKIEEIKRLDHVLLQLKRKLELDGINLNIQSKKDITNSIVKTTLLIKEVTKSINSDIIKYNDTINDPNYVAIDHKLGSNLCDIVTNINKVRDSVEDNKIQLDNVLKFLKLELDSAKEENKILKDKLEKMSELASNFKENLEEKPDPKGNVTPSIGEDETVLSFNSTNLATSSPINKLNKGSS